MNLDFHNCFFPYSHPHHFRFNFNSFASKFFEDFDFQIQCEKVRVLRFLNWGRTGPLITGGNFGDFVV